MRLEIWKQEIIENTLNTLVSVVDENIPLLRARDFNSLRKLTLDKYYKNTNTIDEYKSKEPRLVNLTLNYMEAELERTSWYCFDDCWDSTRNHYGL